MIPNQRQLDLLGKQVRVTNPHLDSSWEGELIGFANHPTLLLEAYDGHQMSLPQSFTIEVVDAPPENRDSPGGGSVTADQRYTLAEARHELARLECATHGHDINAISSGLSTDPIRIVCSRCGDSWAVEPRDAA